MHHLISCDTQLHIIQSHHLHQRRLLMDESLDDLCSKQEVITQQQQLEQTLPVEPGERLLLQNQDLQTPSSVSEGLSFHPEIVSGHHLPPAHTFHQHLLHSIVTEAEHDLNAWSNRQTLTLPHSYHHSHQHIHQDHHQHHHMYPQSEQAVNSTPTSGARVSTSGSSFNSDSLSSTGSILNHPHRLMHNNEFCKSLTRNDGAKKVSFVNPTDSLIIYGGGGTEINSMNSDTRV